MSELDLIQEGNAGYKHVRRFRYEMYRDYMPDIMITYGSGKHYDCPHFHNSFEFLYVENGVMRINLDNEAYEVHAGEYIAISSLAIHECFFDEETAHWTLVFPQAVIGTSAKLMEGKAFDRCIAQDDGTVKGLLNAIFCVRQKTGIYANLTDRQQRSELIRSLCTSVLITAIAACGLCEQPPKRPIAIDALKYIHLHFREPIRVADMAQELLVTQQKLSDSFRQTFGRTINAYISHLRAIDVRANLRDDPDMRLAEAAELSGFGSVRSLLRAYREEFGKTPSEDREESK